MNHIDNGPRIIDHIRTRILNEGPQLRSRPQNNGFRYFQNRNVTSFEAAWAHLRVILRNIKDHTQLQPLLRPLFKTLIRTKCMFGITVKMPESRRLMPTVILAYSL
jgi:hypothetical protein